MAKGGAKRRARRAALLPNRNIPMTFSNSKLTVSVNREFPSLSGAPQAQQNTSAQQMWSNPNLRSTQHSTIQRPQGQGAPQGQTGQVGPQPIQTSGHDEVVGSVPGQFSADSDDYRFGGQAGVGQLSGSQPQTGNIEEFPPLGGSGGDAGPDRRTGLIQNAAAYGANANAGAFPGLGQTRNGMSSPTESQQDRQIGSGLGRALNPSSGTSPKSH
jgi:CCR4-NOT transcription complex subunit 2